MLKIFCFLGVLTTVLVISTNNFCVDFNKNCYAINQIGTKMLNFKNITQLLKKVFDTYFTETEISIVSFLSRNHHYNAFKNEIIAQLSQNSKFTLTKYEIGHFSTKTTPKLPNRFIVFVDDDNIKTEFQHFLTIIPIAPKIIFIIDPNSINKLTNYLTTINQQLNKLNNVLIVYQRPKSYEIVSWQPINRCNQSSYEKIASIQNNQLLIYNITTSNEEYRNCPIVVQVSIWEPFITQAVKNNTLSQPERYFQSFGIEIDLYNVIAKRLNVTFRYVIGADFGDLYPNGTVTHNLLKLYRHEVDTAIGGYILVENSLQHFDFVDYYYDPTHFCVTFTPTKRHLKLLGSSGYKGIGFTLMVLLTLLLYLEAKLQPTEVKYHTFSNVFIMIMRVTLGLSADLKAKTGRVRLILVWMILYGFIMVLCYQTNLTKTLSTETKRKQAIVDIEGIIAANLKIYGFELYKSYFRDTPAILKNYVTCIDANLCITELLEGRRAALIAAETDIIYRVWWLVANEEVYCFSERHSYEMGVLYVGKGFRLLDEFKAIVLRVREAGLISQWRHYFLAHPMKYNRTSSVVGDNNILKALKLSEMKDAFWLWMIGCFAGAIAFGMEMIYFRKKAFS